MLQLRIMWSTLFSVYFILELSIVLVLGLLYICGTGFEIYSDKYVRERLNTPSIMSKYIARLSIRPNVCMATVVSHSGHVNSNITG